MTWAVKVMGSVEGVARACKQQFNAHIASAGDSSEAADIRLVRDRVLDALSVMSPQAAYANGVMVTANGSHSDYLTSIHVEVQRIGLALDAKDPEPT